MFGKIVSIVSKLRGRVPLVYSLVIITLVPLTLVANTLWNLRAFERDMQFVVREEALNVQRMFTTLAQDQKLNSEFYNQSISRIRENISKLTSVTILKPDGEGSFKVAASSDADVAENDAKLLLNQLAWAEGESYFTQINDPKLNQNLWTVVAPIKDSEGQKVALVNFKVSSRRVDSVIARTTRDSLIILLLSVSVVVLLLINHSRFFEQSLMYEKLKEVDRMKDDFISVASHELRTPLTAIKGYVALVEKELAGQLTEKTRKKMVVINQSVQRLENLVEDLLNVSRIEQNRMDFELSPVDTNSIIQETISQLLPNAQRKGLKLIFEPMPSPAYALAHPDRLREVLVNLIGNAIKYTPKGQVTVQQTVDKEKVKISVRDTGLGIAPEDQGRLFQKFTRIQTKQTLDIPGTGLGLWITKQIVKRMRGEIYLSSIEGEGTVFTVVLQQTGPAEGE